MKAISEYLCALHPTDDVHLTECRWYPNNGYMVHYSLGDPGTVNYWRDVIAFIETVGQAGALGLRWSHNLDRHPTTKPEPLGDILGATENVGSCEPGPMILWDKTQKTWHTDTKAGRYSVKRMGKRMPYAAFLNNKQIAAEEHTNVEVVKRSVERRIIEAARINKLTEPGKPGPRLLQELLPRVGNSALNKR